MRARVLHTLVPARLGGLERVVQELSSGRSRCGGDTSVLAVIEGRESPMLQELRRRGVRLIVVRVAGRHYLREWRSARDAMRACCPDIVHTHGARADVIHASAARHLGIPTVTTLHGFTRNGWKGRLYERLQRRSARNASAVIAVSRELKEEMVQCGVSPDRIHVQHNGVPEISYLSRADARDELRLGITEERLSIGWIGRLSPEKGLDVLLDALGLLTNLNPHLTVFGEGPAAGHLKRKADGVPVEVAWEGFVPHAARHLRAFDVFVLSSRTEGSPLTLLEAMEAGVPIIAARVGGVCEMIDPDGALLVEPESPRELAQAIEEVARHPEQALKRAVTAKARLPGHSRERWLQAYEEIYSRVLKV